MKIEELLDCSAAELKAMTDAELLQHFEPYFTVTRPELAVRPKAASGKPTGISVQTNQKLQQLKALGIEIDPRIYLKKKR